MACTIVSFVTAAGLRIFSLPFLSLRMAKNGSFLGLRGWGEGEEEDLGERISKVLKFLCIFSFGKNYFLPTG